VPDPGAAVAVVDPATGELLEALHTQPPERLADVAFELRARQGELRKMQQAVEAELRRRMVIRDRRLVVFGDYEVKLTRESVWDAEELEGVLGELVDRGAVHASELTRVIRRETTVSRTEANRLLTRLSGSARDAIERCMSWRTSGRLQIARSVALFPPEEVSRDEH
jgi:hypothetical protein